jgi:hypothetical protein
LLGPSAELKLHTCGAGTLAGVAEHQHTAEGRRARTSTTEGTLSFEKFRFFSILFRMA